MAERGPYKKGVAKRAEILDTALVVIHKNGYSNATVKELAEAVGLSQNGLLHYFGSKDELFIEILRHHDVLMSNAIRHEPEDLAQGFAARVVGGAEFVASDPGLLELTMRLSMEATDPAHPAHDYFKNRYQVLKDVTSGALRALQKAGHLSSDVDPDITAVLINAATEGLQTRWFYDRSIDLGAHLDHMLRALGIAVDTTSPE